MPDLLRLTEDIADYRVFVLSLKTQEKPAGDRPPGIDGAYQSSRGDAFILVNSADRHPVKMRFTLAHEIGHHELGHGSRVDESINFQMSDTYEIQANQYAAELLVPRSGVLAWLDDSGLSLETIVRLAFHFNVSVPAVRYRVENIGVLSGILKKGKLDRAIDAQEHFAMARDLGLKRHRDSLDAVGTWGDSVPMKMRALVGRLLREGMLSEDAAKARLRLDGPEADRELAELIGTGSPRYDGED